MRCFSKTESRWETHWDYVNTLEILLNSNLFSQFTLKSHTNSWGKESSRKMSIFHIWFWEFLLFIKYFKILPSSWYYLSLIVLEAIFWTVVFSGQIFMQTKQSTNVQKQWATHRASSLHDSLLAVGLVFTAIFSVGICFTFLLVPTREWQSPFNTS